jgi:hypothetical protein
LLSSELAPAYAHSVIAYSIGANASAPPAAIAIARPTSARRPSFWLR